MNSKTSTPIERAIPPDAEPPAPGASADVGSPIIEQLHERVGPSKEVVNRRQSERRPWITPLTILIEDPMGKPRTLEATTHDISTGGFSFVYRQFIHINTKVRVYFESLPGRPALEGVVRSCTYAGEMHHRIGVQFVKPEDSKSEKRKPQPS